MSLSELTTVDTITPQTESISVGSSGGVNESYSDESTLSCLVQEVSSKERLDYASRGISVDVELFFSSSPDIGIDKRIKLNTVGGEADGRICRVTGAYKEGRPGETLLWVVLANFLETRLES